MCVTGIKTLVFRKTHRLLYDTVQPGKFFGLLKVSSLQAGLKRMLITDYSQYYYTGGWQLSPPCLLVVTEI